MKINLSDVWTVGHGLIRPEGVMALDDGTVLAADARGQCARIAPDHGVFVLWGPGRSAQRDLPGRGG